MTDALPAIGPGGNIALKVPASRYDDTVAFYRDAVGLEHLEHHADSEVFAFGSIRLWVDRIPHATHAEVWLEVTSPDVDGAAARLTAAGGTVVDEIEPLGDVAGHWVLDPAGAVLLLSERSD